MQFTKLRASGTISQQTYPEVHTMPSTYHMPYVNRISRKFSDLLFLMLCILTIVYLSHKFQGIPWEAADICISVVLCVVFAKLHSGVLYYIFVVSYRYHHTQYQFCYGTTWFSSSRWRITEICLIGVFQAKSNIFYQLWKFNQAAMASHDVFLHWAWLLSIVSWIALSLTLKISSPISHALS